MGKPFLLRARPDLDAGPGRRFAFWLWNIGLVALAGLGIGADALLLAVGPYGLNVARGYLEHPLILLLNLLPPLALILLLYALTGRAGVSFGVTAGVSLGLSVANYYKLMFRDDPLLFGDLLLLKEATDMAGKYKLFLDKKLALVLVTVVAGWAILHLLARGRPQRGRLRAVGGLLAAALMSLTMAVSLDPVVYDRHTAYYARLSNIWSSTQQYLARGFLYPFLHSTAAAVEVPPAGYDAHEAAALLAQTSDADIPADRKVNVVAIMLESFNDFTRLGVPELAQDVYGPWHALEEEGYSGTLVTNIFAGGTVDTERAFLTGSTGLGAFRSPTNAYPWYFRSQGYTAEGMHPCYDWFYNRRNINENLGFERYAFVENHFAPLTGGAVARDEIFFPELLKAYRSATAGDKPVFSFSVTYQGHGPYDSDVCWWGEKGDFVVDDGTYPEDQQYILDNYFGSIADTNRHIRDLVDFLRADSAPVVLVLFGDHNPWLGDGNSVYKAMGINLDMDTREGFLNYYSTPYVIWANDPAKAALGSDFRGKGPTISPAFLMDEVFRLCGWEGPAFRRAAVPAKDRVPVIHATGRHVADGELVDRLAPGDEELVRQYRSMDYYNIRHFAYDHLTK